MSEIVKMGRRGEIQLPRRVRAAFGLREGDELLVSCDEECILLKRRARRFGEYLHRLTGVRSNHEPE
jgi:AbrB family looped-hinge helix DNA binding protein